MQGGLDRQVIAHDVAFDDATHSADTLGLAVRALDDGETHLVPPGGAQIGLHREADAVHGVAYLAAPAHGTSLLATVQMLDLLRMEIGELSQSPVSEQLVPPLLQAFLRQLEHWCADVEVALGWIRRDTLAPEGLEKFLYVSDDLAIASLE